ncbi:hypothetical protein [Massilia sp. TS11]|uniref:hypothetical protein n=1 Tax=Massilia sp. TS11 TaxID=2908003 RepID=UPI001EDB4785|nr:hypothetical protein [Massilia sp. TS11]MCG2586534.1 hypothetical protein [Massilia sp. TS11]
MIRPPFENDTEERTFLGGVEELATLVKAAQTALTEHMAPLGPSKADTIAKLTDTLLGARAAAALAAVGES